jgi:serine phosphatase RsbU (regulator of sigma subunit)
MKLRTQLVVVFLLLAILPLGGIVLYSYSSSQRAFREAVEKETRTLAAQMDSRMTGIREDLGRRIERIGGLPLDTLVAASDPAGPGSEDATAALAFELGEAAEFFDRIEWTADEKFDTFSSPDGRPAVATGPSVPRVAQAPASSGSPAVPAPPAAPEAPEARTFVIEIPRFEVGPTGSAVMVGTETKTIVAPNELRVDELQAGVREAIADARRIADERRRVVEAQRDDMRKQLMDRAATGEMSTLVVSDGATWGVLTAQLREEAIVRKVLAGTAPESDDVAFAIDPEGALLTTSDDDRATLSGLDIDAIARGESRSTDNWVVATSKDSETGLTFCVARPVRDSLRRMRASALNNFMWGLGLVAIALVGVVPVANHLTRDIEHVMEGVDRIGHGDLESPVEVTSSNEIGRLALAFNRMALDLKSHQQRLVDEERRGREREVERRILEVEYQRKSLELEEARDFQLSLLPDSPPTHPDLDIAVLVRTATEVGGDYYDYHTNSDGSLTLAIGDATGHGARAGTMVTVVKSLFAGRADSAGLSDFLDESNRTIRQMKLERMAMALTVARLSPHRIELAAAGMPPVLVHRAATGVVDELQCEAPPLGSLAHAYQSLATDLAPGDVVLMMTDGFPELHGPAGEPLGYDTLQSLFRDVAAQEPTSILQAFADAADRWTEGEPPSDDITFIAIRVRGA